MQIDGRNYLIPTDFDAIDEVEARHKAYDAGLLRELMERSGARLNVIVLDACRSNPYTFNRAGLGGLARMEPGRGTLIALATGPGRTASDNPGAQNGLFTKHLLEALGNRGLKLREIFEQTRTKVDAASGRAQTPWVLSNVIGDPYLVPAGPSTVAVANAPGGSVALELAFWKSVEKDDSEEMYRLYLRRYPGGQFAEIAGARLGKAAASTPPAEVDSPESLSTQQLLTLGHRALENNDFKVALRAFSQAAERGDPEAMTFLGVIHEKGLGVSQNVSEAIRWYQAAATQGSLPARLQLGLMHEHGVGFPRDAGKAAEWYLSAAEQGFPPAQDRMGKFYRAGNGVALDQGLAVQWFRRAAEQGYPEAQYNLATQYAVGLGSAQGRNGGSPVAPSGRGAGTRRRTSGHRLEIRHRTWCGGR